MQQLRVKSLIKLTCCSDFIRLICTLLLLRLFREINKKKNRIITEFANYLAKLYEYFVLNQHTHDLTDNYEHTNLYKYVKC